MIDVGLRDNRYLPAPQLHAPAKVYLLHVGKEALVQASKGLPYGRAYHEAGAGAPEDIGGGVVLAVVLFKFLHNSATAERIAEAVYEASRGTGVLKGVALLEREELGAAGAALRMGVHPLLERF